MRYRAIALLVLLSASLVAASNSMLPRHLGVRGVVTGRSVPGRRCQTVTKRIHGKNQPTRVCAASIRPPPLHAPTGIVIGRAGNVWIMDAGDDRLLKVSSKGKPLGHWGARGPGAGQFNAPNFITLDTDGNVYIADTGNNRVEKFSSHGGFLAQWGGSGLGPGQFEHPTGVAVDGEGNVFIADTYNNRVQKLSPAGVPLAAWGVALALHHPSGVALDTHGNLVIADSRNQRVVTASASGQLLRSFGTDRGLNKPDGIAIDSRDRIYVADRANNRVEIFSSSGSPLLTMGSPGTQHGQLRFPVRGFLNGVAVDAHGTVYVADTGNNRLQEFSSRGKVLAVWK